MVQNKGTFEAVFALKVIDCASQYSNRAAARMCGIDEKRVCEQQKKQKEELATLLEKKKRLQVAS